MLKIRLMRIGAKQKPFYRVVVVEERSKRNGSYVELLGTYNPLTEPKEIKLKQDRIDHWIKQGAQPSVGYLRIIGKAPQRAPRKPKKEAKQDGGGAAAATPAPAAAGEEPKTEETPPATEQPTEPAAEATQAPVEETTATETAETPIEESPTEEAPTEESEKKDEGSA